MRLAVASCWQYRDAWKPFLDLLDKFWPTHPPVDLITDVYKGGLDQRWRVRLFAVGEGATWCQAVSTYAGTMNESILLMQEDFFLAEPVNEYLILNAYALGSDAACVRLYPCPGADQEKPDIFYGYVNQDAGYRVSCQAAIWKPDFLKRIADHSMGSAASFEIAGTQFAQTQKEIVLAFKRYKEPWPMRYICSGISRGLWNPDSKKLCDLHGIQNDWSMRAFAS